MSRKSVPLRGPKSSRDRLYRQLEDFESPITMIGFDDLPDATGQDPPLTSRHYPIFEAGRTALALTLDLINGRLSGDQNIRLPMHLTVRESCGCLPNNLPVEIVLCLQKSNKTPANARDVIVKRIVEILRKEIDFLESAEVEKVKYSVEIPRICSIISLALPLSFTLFISSQVSCILSIQAP